MFTRWDCCVAAAAVTPIPHLHHRHRQQAEVSVWEMMLPLLRGKSTTTTMSVRTLSNIATVVGVEDQINGVVSGQGDVGQTADEPGRVLVQRAKYYIVHAAYTCNAQPAASLRLTRSLVWSAIGIILSSVCPSVCLWRCALWLNDTAYSKSVWTSECELPLEKRFYNFHPPTLILSAQTHLHHRRCCHLANKLKHTYGFVTFLPFLTLSPLTCCSRWWMTFV